MSALSGFRFFKILNIKLQLFYIVMNKIYVLVPSFSYVLLKEALTINILCTFFSKVKPYFVFLFLFCYSLIASPVDQTNFCTVWRMNNNFYLLPFTYPLFQIQFPTESLSHLNIIFSFIIYSFFNNYSSSNIFFIQYLIIIIEKKYLKNEQQLIKSDELLFMSLKKFRV